MDRLRRVTSAAIAVAAAMGALSGCATGPYGYDLPPRPVTETQILGHWAEQGGNCPGAELTFVAGGTAQVKALRDDEDVESYTSAGMPLRSGAATWRLDAAVRDYPQNIQFQVQDRPYEADFGQDAKGLVIVVTIGDPDSGVACTYRRAAAR